MKSYTLLPRSDCSFARPMRKRQPICRAQISGPLPRLRYRSTPCGIVSRTRAPLTSASNSASEKRERPNEGGDRQMKSSAYTKNLPDHPVHGPINSPAFFEAISSTRPSPIFAGWLG